MSGIHKRAADQFNIVSSADNLLARKSLTFAHPDEVMDDQELTLADKRSLLASWASDALAIEDTPSLRQLASGAVVCVDDVFAALKSLDLQEPQHEVAATFIRSFPRRHSRPPARRLRLRPDDDDEPPPRAAGAVMPTGRGVLIAGNRGNVAS